MISAEFAKGRLIEVCLLIFGIICIGFFLLFLITGFTAKFNTGNAVGMAMSLFMGLVLLFPNKTAEIVSGLWKTGGGRAFVVIFLSFAAVCIVLAVIISVQMIKAADNLPHKPTNIIVLGCRVKENGPSLMLEKRINAAYEYLSENPDTLCIASGGKGTDEPVSEAICIRDELVKRGIPSERIILEDKSSNTYENIRNSLEIMDSLGMERNALIITSEFHQLRASMICKKAGLTSYSKSSQTYLPLLPSYWIREWFAVAYEWIKK